MLSAEERRRLDEIERLLQMHDPDFVARMRAGNPPRRWLSAMLYGLLWIVVIVLWVGVGWLVGVAAAAIVGLVTAIASYRRNRGRHVGWDPVR
jgi:Flp pilus assembly protein TadB